MGILAVASVVMLVIAAVWSDDAGRRSPGRKQRSMSQSTITFLILAVTVAVFVWDHLPVGVVAFGVALSLRATGVLDLEQALAGFRDPTVLFIASLFVVSEALRRPA